MAFTCKDCVFGGKCRRYEPCSEFYPVGEDAEDQYIQDEIERSRLAYMEELEEYVSDFN